MKTSAAILLLLILLCGSAWADSVVQRDDFDDGNLTADPRWTYVQPGSVSISDERSTSGAYSLKVASANEMGAVHTCSGVRTVDQTFTCTFNLFIESMGDEAIPWSVQNSSTGVAAIIFILPGGRVQLYVPDSVSGKYANVVQPMSYGAWHSFRITYDGSTTNLYLDGHAAPDASIAQTYLRAPLYACIGNFVMPHTSTFFVDDLVFTRPGDATPAKVYVQVCSDTSTGGINIASRYIDFPELDNTYTTPEGQAARVMAESYRDAHRDSLGNAIKFTWYMQTGSLYAAGTDSGPLLPFELMEDYHGDSIDRWGDEMAYHYHTWIWNDPNADGAFHWNQSPDFSYCMEDFDCTMAHMLIDRGFYPSSFRSGWHYMDNLWQRHLDDWIPYRFENDWPAYRTTTEEPVGNIYDWRRAPSDWTPYHPDPNDYQSPGTLRGWDSRSESISSATTAVLTDAFYKALDGEPQLMTLFSHLKETDFPEQVDALHARLTDLHGSLPMVEFEYLTGRECMLRWRDGSDVTPPNLQVTSEDDASIRTVTLSYDEEIYQLQPFVARLGTDGSYSRLDCTHSGPNRWQIQFEPADTLTIAVGATDWFGNQCVEYLRSPLRLIDPGVSDVTTTTADVGWKTNLPADSRLEYAVVGPDGLQSHFDAKQVLQHRIRLEGLAPGVVYRIDVASEDEFGQRAESEPIYIVTRADDAVIVDNLDAAFSVEGGWSTGNVTPGAYGPDYRYAMASPSGTSKAYWTRQAPETGIYRIQARWSAGANRTTTARYSIIVGPNEYNTTVNQQIDGGQWNQLGVSELSAGETITVRLTNVADSGYVVLADSVRFEPAFVTVPSIGVARTLGDGESILVSGAVTGVFGSWFYIEALDRSSAIKVQGLGVGVGDVVQVGGRLTTVLSERALAGEHIGKTGETVNVRPVTILSRDIESSCPPGLLVTVWGRISSVGDGFIYLDDGSGLRDCTSTPGIRVDSSVLSPLPPEGDYAIATGVLSMAAGDCGLVRVVLPRTAADIFTYPL